MDSVDDSTNDKCLFNVSVIDLLNFGGPNMMRNGEEVYKSSHLLSLGVVAKGLKTCIIEGQCLQSSHPSDSPHTITINTEETFKNWKFFCSCKAGNGGRCKHVFAALLHINIFNDIEKHFDFGYVRTGLQFVSLNVHNYFSISEKSLEVLTSTEHKQYWGKVAKKVAVSVLEPSLIKDLKEMKAYESSRKSYKLTTEEFDFCKATLFSDPNSAIATFLQRASKVKLPNIELPSCNNDGENDLREIMKVLYEFNFNLRFFIFMNKVEKNFYNKRICIDLNDAVELSIATRDQKNSLWHSERRLRITASECYYLYTSSNNPNVDWQKRIANYFKPKPKLKYFTIGLREEPFAIKLYEKEKQCIVTKIGLVVHPSCPWFGCSPDGFVVDSKTIVEVKTIMNEKNEEFHIAMNSISYLGRNGEEYFLRRKHKFYAQIQMNMHLLRASRAHLVVHNYKTSQIHVIEVYYDEEFALELSSSLAKVYFAHVLPFVFKNFTTLEDQKKYY